MGLNVLDFLSSSPDNYIFQKKSNKTNFGGVCQLLSILLILGLAIYYLIKFFQKDSYSIEYIPYILDIEHEIKDKNKKIKFAYDILNTESEVPLSKNFALMIGESKEIIPRNKSISENIIDINYLLVYECQDDKCEFEEKSFDLAFIYNMSLFNLQKDNPIISFITPPECIPIYINDFLEYRFYFEESKCTTFGFFGDKNVSILIPKKFDTFTYHYTNTTKDKGSTKYKAIGEINFYLNDGNWDHYKRTKKSILDTISNICSLGLTIYNAFKNGFLLLYSSNFNNYKIIQTILSGKVEKLKQSKKIKTNKEMKALDNNSDILLSKPANYDNNNEELDEQNMDNEKIKITYEEMHEESDINFPKLSFMSYIFNIIYCQSCCNIKNQKFISKCNEIVSKYYSVEKILYNQILIENLLKDYKWNDPRLKSVESNELIKNLKIYIRNNYFNSDG